MRARAAPLFLTALGLAGTCAGQRHVYPGRVLDEAGKPVAGATVTARWCGHPELPDLVGWTLGEPDDLGCPGADLQTDAAGRFRFELPVRGPVALVARDAKGDRQSLRCFPLMAGDFRDLQLRPAAVVAGRVVAADGAPLAERELVLEPERSTWAWRALHACPTARVRLRTDGDGRFRQLLEQAWPEAPMWEPLLVLRPADDAIGFATEVNVRPLPELAALALVAAPRPTLSGFLRDVAGVPLPGGRVYERHAPWRSVRTGEAGAFAVAAANVSDLAFVAAGHSPAAIPNQNSRRRPPADLGIGLLRCRHVALRLVDEQGRPLPAHEVLWSLAEGGGPPLEWLASTDAEGRIELDGSLLTTTSGFVRCDGRWHRFLRRRIARDEDLGDVAVAWRALAGEVVGADGVPCAGARVLAVERDQVTPAFPPYWVTYTDRGGRFRLPSLPRSPFRLQVEAGVRGLAELTVGADDEHCAVRLAAGASVEVEVRDERGVVAGCRVALTESSLFDPRRQQTHRFDPVFFGVTDERGCVRFGGLPDGRWQAIVDRLHDGRRQVGRGEVGAERLTVVLVSQAP